MLMSHMESKDQRWPNVRLGELGDIFNNGFSDMMMNNLWVYDFNILEESQNHHISGLPVPEYPASDTALSSSRFLDLLVDPQENRENDDPNSIKITEMVESKVSQVTQKSIKGPRSKRCKRTVFEGPWNFTSTPSVDLYGSVDNQGSGLSKRMLGEHDFGEPGFKKQRGENLEKNDLVSESISVNSVGRWLEDVGFGRYAGVFEMHEVDEEALPLLTLDDLKEMGVLAVGTRRKLYAAICRLKGK
ncbi:hypothetical protein SSX86_013927 [Deinandra increscens subsp. villosa]|uniref:SAM domain-containing protein n=1 Tax=Deinandra increscens subsp. villosa TaxID=3103831 RepID=A0AAP0D183_9ASTR